LYGSKRIVQKGGIDPNSPIRESQHIILWPSNPSWKIHGVPDETGPGSPGWITITEQGIHQSYDLTRVMFSRGNISEKIRTGKSLVKPNDVVLDMYAGIGYYTLPSLKFGHAKHVYACEWNQEAVRALKYNLKHNGVEGRCTVLEGDCRVLVAKEENGLRDRMDRVFLGMCVYPIFLYESERILSFCICTQYNMCIRSVYVLLANFSAHVILYS